MPKDGIAALSHFNNSTKYLASIFDISCWIFDIHLKILTPIRLAVLLASGAARMQIDFRSYIVIFISAALILGGCAGGQRANRLPSSDSAPATDTGTETERAATAALQNDLMALNGYADVEEATRVAESVMYHSARLAEDYKLVRPAAFHNVLVRIGLKDRGLCHHWTTDLMKQLQELQLKTYQLYWGVAYRGSELREHNSVVIAARGDSFENGMVLDPWRYSGVLFWDRVENDRYPWKERPRHEW
jgi:hypothetical protein